jgi:hypothetical protein
LVVERDQYLNSGSESKIEKQTEGRKKQKLASLLRLLKEKSKKFRPNYGLYAKKKETFLSDRNAPVQLYTLSLLPSSSSMVQNKSRKSYRKDQEYGFH